LLSNGKVVITGPPSVEIYDPASASDTRLGLIDHGTGAVVLKDDKLVIVGGSDVSLYDVTGDSLQLLATRSTTTLYDQTATLLSNGKVLISGGHVNGFGQATVDEASLYDARRTTIDGTGRLLVSRTLHTATLLPGGRVLIYGGYHVGSDSQEVRLADAEEYDPDTGSFADAGHGAWPRGALTATLLHDGTVLIAGGALNTSAELYIPPLRAASAASVNGPLAPESLGSLFGSRLALATVTADPLPLPQEDQEPPSSPTSLGGISVRLGDSAGVARLAPLYYVSPSRIDFEVPAGTASGDITLDVLNSPTQLPPVTAQIRPVAPGLFTFDDGTPVGYFFRLEPNQTATIMPLRNTILLDDRPVYLILYATGTRNHSSLANVQCSIGSVSLPVEYAGPSGAVPGLDQVNIRLTPALKGLGLANLVLTVDGIASNTVSVDVR
jgi:uncharacterized protein (TIGR03437 family)